MVRRPPRVLLLKSGNPFLPRGQEAALFPMGNAQLETYASSVDGYQVTTGSGDG